MRHINDLLEKDMRASTGGKSALRWAAMILVIIAIALPRFLALRQYVTPDEHLWVSRSANFYYALGQRDFAATYQQVHPGVTAMWAGTAAFLLRYPAYRGSGTGQLDPDQFHYYITKIRELQPLDLLVPARAFMILGQILCLAIAFLYAAKLIGIMPALLGFLFIAFDPFHTALTRVLHLDGLMSNLILLSVLGLLYYVKERKFVALVVSSLAAGLAFLTKSPAFLLIPAAGLIYIWFTWDSMVNAFKRRSLPMLWMTVYPLLLWGGLAGLCFIILWPAMWVNPLGTLNNMLFKAQDFAESGHYSTVFYNGHLYSGSEMGPKIFSFYPVSFLWRTTPAIVFGLLFAAIGWIKKQHPFDQLPARLLSTGLLLAVLLFLLGFTLASKKFDRYILPIFAPLDILAGLGWIWAAANLQALFRGQFARTAYIFAVVVPLVIQLSAVASTYPYYLTYYNPLLGGSQKAPQVMQIGWGEGIEQAAKYLNQLPLAKDLHVSAWYAAGCFSYYFEGHTRSINYRPEKRVETWERFISSDYAVIYIHQWQRQIPKPVLDYVSKLQPIHTIWLNGLEYVRIYKLR